MNTISPFFNDKVIEELTKKFSQFGPRLFVLFGSYAEGKEWRSSDLDFGFLMERRITEEYLSDLLLELMRISGLEHVQAIDLFYDAQPQRVQIEVYRHGTCLYEVEQGLFDMVKGASLSFSPPNFIEWDRQIILEKLASLKVSVDKLAVLVEQPYEKDENLLLIVEKRAEEAVRSMIKLNRMVLERFFGLYPGSAWESVDLLKHTQLFSDELLAYLTKSIIFQNIESIDYYHGSSWSIGILLKRIVWIYPQYVDILKKYFHDPIVKNAE